MLELVDKTDFWNFSDEEFECPIGNYKSRISLIKHLFSVVEWRTNEVTDNSLSSYKCDGNLVYGDIDFGDDELNWIKHLNVGKYFIKEVEGHMR